MGCVSSKLLKKNIKREILLFGNGGDLPNHVVSLTSSTYGALKLDKEPSKSPTNHPQNTQFQAQQPNKKDDNAAQEQKSERDVCKNGVFGSKRSPSGVELEVINTWELMSDLEEEIPISNQSKKSPKLVGVQTPFKSLGLVVDTPKCDKKLGGKENDGGVDPNKLVVNHSYTTPKRVLKSWRFSSNSSSKLRKPSSMESPRRSSSGVCSSRRRSLTPMFDPDLIDSIEKELSQEQEHIKMMVSPKKTPIFRYSSRNGTNSSSTLLEKYVEKCPPGGEDCVVIYTTTLRGIRRTFEECNAVRSVIESHHIRVIERDISMDSGFKEELRKLMGKKEVRVPLVFVKGRLIGGAEEVVRLEEEGKLEALFVGIRKAVFGCEGCGGIRFVMCMDCNGSCKVLDEDQKSMIRCGECNENGLIQCPLCC